MMLLAYCDLYICLKYIYNHYHLLVYLQSTYISINKNIAKTAPYWQQTISRLQRHLFECSKYCQIYIKVTRENLFHSYIASGKSFQTVIPVARYSLLLPRLSIHYSQIVTINHPIKIKLFHVLYTKINYCACTFSK